MFSREFTFSLVVACGHVLFLPLSGRAQEPDFRILDVVHAADSLVVTFESPLENPDAFSLQSNARLEGGTWTTVIGATALPLGERRFEFRVAVENERADFFRVAALSTEPGTLVYINEVMTDNESTVSDAAGDFPDWIELYNPAGTPLDLGGFGLSDDAEQLGKWIFPEGATIAPGGYLLVFASGGEDGLQEGEWHAGFKLANGEEPVILTNREGAVIDRIDPGPLASDVSLGRAVGDFATWYAFDDNRPSPGAENARFLFGAPDPFIEAPQFSVPGGLHAGEVIVEITSSVEADVIRYTLDGSEPVQSLFTGSSPRVDGPLTISEPTVVRAKVFREGNRSRTVSASYLIGVEHALPVLSLAANPGSFDFVEGELYGFGRSLFTADGHIIGNYPWSQSNAWRDREIAVNLEMFEDNGAGGFNITAGLKIFGGWGSRGYPQKSFAVFARREYGYGRIRHRLFPDKDIDSFESVILRNSGNDNQSTWLTVPRSEIRTFSEPQPWGSYFVNGNFTLFRDALMQSLVRDTGLDIQAYRPTVLYLNGDYWGIYNLREKMNEHYLASNHGVSSDAVDLIEGYGTANAGSSEVYNAMRAFVGGRDLSDDAHYETVLREYLELDNFIDYHLAVIYFQNFDIGNIKCWRPQMEGGRFRWLLYDQDYGFNLWKPEVYLPAMKRDFADYENMFTFYTNPSGSGTGWPNAGGRTLLLRKMLENAKFKERFISRCADLLNSVFASDPVVARIDEMAAVIRSEIPRHLERWSWAGIRARGFGHPHKPEDEPLDIQHWERNVEGLCQFGRNRPVELRLHLMEHFQLDGGTVSVGVNVNDSEMGKIEVNTLTEVATYPWTGVYFRKYPPELQAIARPGHRFTGWTGTTDSTDPVFTAVFPDGEGSVEWSADFERIPLTRAGDAAVVVSELHYHPAENQTSGAWIELCNRGNVNVDLTGWFLFDESDSHRFVFPPFQLQTGECAVIANNPQTFLDAYSSVSGDRVIGELTFDFGNGGDGVRLLNAEGALIESFRYDDRGPWSESADGGGFTLTRIDLDAPAEDPSNWARSDLEGGSPGER